MYNPVVPSRGRQRIYRGLYGAAAFQSVYRGGGQSPDVVHCRRAGRCVSSVRRLRCCTRSWHPRAAVKEIRCSLAAIDAGHAHPPRALESTECAGWCRWGLCVMQPLVRSWGRLRHGGFVLGTFRPNPRPPPAAARRCERALVRSPAAEIAAGIVDTLRRARSWVLPATGWEDHDGEVIASSFVRGELVTSAHPPGCVQVRVRRRLRRLRLAVAVLISAGLTALAPGAGLAVVGVVCLELVRGCLPGR